MNKLRESSIVDFAAETLRLPDFEERRTTAAPYFAHCLLFAATITRSNRRVRYEQLNMHSFSTHSF